MKAASVSGAAFFMRDALRQGMAACVGWLSGAKQNATGG